MPYNRSRFGVFFPIKINKVEAEAFAMEFPALRSGYNFRFYHTFAAEDMNGRVVSASSETMMKSFSFSDLALAAVFQILWPACTS